MYSHPRSFLIGTIKAHLYTCTNFVFTDLIFKNFFFFGYFIEYFSGRPFWTSSPAGCIWRFFRYCRTTFSDFTGNFRNQLTGNHRGWQRIPKSWKVWKNISCRSVALRKNPGCDVVELHVLKSFWARQILQVFFCARGVVAVQCLPENCYKK